MGNVETTFMAAQICAVVVNVVSALFRGKNERHRTISPMDFVPQWAGEESKARPKRKTTEKTSAREQTVEQQKSIIMSLAKAFGAKIKRRENVSGRHRPS